MVRLLAVCAASAASRTPRSSQARVRSLTRGFYHSGGRVAETSQGVARLCARLLARVFLGAELAEPGPPGYGILSLVAAMDAVLLLRAARPWLTARDQRAARTTTPAVNAGDAQ